MRFWCTVRYSSAGSAARSALRWGQALEGGHSIAVRSGWVPNSGSSASGRLRSILRSFRDTSPKRAAGTATRASAVRDLRPLLEGRQCFQFVAAPQLTRSDSRVRARKRLREPVVVHVQVLQRRAGDAVGQGLQLVHPGLDERNFAELGQALGEGLKLVRERPGPPRWASSAAPPAFSETSSTRSAARGQHVA